MSTITDRSAIASLFAQFNPAGNANIVGQGPQYVDDAGDLANYIVWVQRGAIDNRDARVTWHMTDDECAVEDGADMPFDLAHIASIDLDESE